MTSIFAYSLKQRRLMMTLPAALLLLSGCAVGPDFTRPAAPAVNGYTQEPLATKTVSAPVAGGEAQYFASAEHIPQQWWTLFQSPALNKLIEQALKNNPNLQQAEAALRVAQETVYAQQGAYYPSVSANFTPTRQKEALNSVSSSAASGASLFNLHTAQLNVSYTADVFGNNRRQVENLQAQADSQRFLREAAYLTLTSNVVTAAVQEASLRAQISATNAMIKIEQEQLDLFQRQFELGAVAQANVVAQVATLAQTKAMLPPLQKQLAQQRDLLAALVGGFPGDPMPETFELSMLQLPRKLPVSLPSQLVQQRPDVRSAEEQLHAASALVGVAQSNMLPQFTLSASGGSMSTQISQLFSPGNSFWTLVGGITQPLFDGGTLLHKKRAAEAAYDEAAAQYRSTVISAFQNVADTLQALQFDADGLQTALIAERAAAESLAIARRQVELGDIGYVTLLAAEQSYQLSVLTLVQAQANRYADTAALFQAMGGGWWNQADNVAR
ncbi:efflux transporter outer membrane subunit [Solimicrobium silvestre]|uniref:Efflux transporter, outer membrane factor (OMF) lipoprotein, NodT family n=1 Tax=Solimicrobium silvestre TaxID=2099400 RepID=A0A2S9GW54_9BURK|nr:efflux transporter outer membrane subunit [Solimicrobium silvestre]PRC91957.1 Efflux transporter, outer membrane factor (OMF) lipoprotein, NodT family [Solimicrobium silvestre]